MPTINKPKKERKPFQKENEYTDAKLLRRKAYNSSEWKKLRAVFIQEHPLCSNCLKSGKIVPAIDVHHKRSPFDYRNGTINMALLLDENNLESLCKDCHSQEHSPRTVSPEEVLAALDEFLKDIPD